jgi:hypothetical protein
LGYFFHGKSCGLGYILGDFFTNAFGHPGCKTLFSQLTATSKMSYKTFLLFIEIQKFKKIENIFPVITACPKATSFNHVLQ